MLIRGLYYEGWDPSNKALKERRPEQFLARIEHELRDDGGFDPEWVARSVFTVLAMRVSDGEIEDVKHLLPEKLRYLWPET